MWETVELPVWVVALGVVLALLALLDRVIGPTMRWVLRRRLARAIDELNARLDISIQPFKLTERRVLIDRLVWDPDVLSAVDEHCRETGMPRDAAMAAVTRYAREIVPSFSAFTYFRIGARVSKAIAESFYRVRLGAFDKAALARVGPEATVVFVMNHRSNFDYLLVTYLSSQQSALSYAVGEWARVWPLSRIVRAMGAYFIRRRSRNALYRRVLARYVAMATDAGVTQAIFPEGGLSRDGRIGAPKLGLLSYIVAGFDPAGPRDVVFVPVGLNYDRVLEDRVLISAKTHEDGRPRFRASIPSVAGVFLHLFWLRLRGRLHRFGYACVSFGEPLSLTAFLTGRERGDPVAELGAELTARIGAVVPVLPVSLIAGILLDAEAPLSRAELSARAFARLDRLAASGAHIHVPHADRDYAVEVGLRMLRMRQLVTGTDDAISAAAAETDVLAYYANAIEHLETTARAAAE
jgi:glycerol-3-phosphate O-acyltransferase